MALKKDSLFPRFWFSIQTKNASVPFPVKLYGICQSETVIYLYTFLSASIFAKAKVGDLFVQHIYSIPEFLY